MDTRWQAIQVQCIVWRARHGIAVDTPHHAHGQTLRVNAGLLPHGHIALASRQWPCEIHQGIGLDFKDLCVLVHALIRSFSQCHRHPNLLAAECRGQRCVECPCIRGKGLTVEGPFQHTGRDQTGDGDRASGADCSGKGEICLRGGKDRHGVDSGRGAAIGCGGREGRDVGAGGRRRQHHRRGVA